LFKFRVEFYKKGVQSSDPLDTKISLNLLFISGFIVKAVHCSEMSIADFSLFFATILGYCYWYIPTSQPGLPALILKV
jgi:hypothetical protein